MKVINTQICSATGYKELMKYEQKQPIVRSWTDIRCNDDLFIVFF